MQYTDMRMVATVLFFLVMSLSFGSADADEVTDSIREALQQYNKGAYSEAAGSLEYASQLIRQKKGEKLQSFLPEPLKGWTANDSTSQAIGAAIFGGGVSAERKYNKGSGSVTISIVSDSPLLQNMMMMFTNPMMAGTKGGKLEKVGSQKAIVNYSPTNKNGEINIVVANRFLVTVKGRRVSKEDLTDYAMDIQYKKLADLP